MTEDEYRDFLSFLFERYMRPRIPLVRSRYRHHMEDEFSHHLDQAVRASHVLRFVESYCLDDDDAYSTFTPERLQRSVSDARYSLEFSNRIVEEVGFLDACEVHAREIAGGLAARYLPEAEKDVLREMGSPNPELELRSLVYRAKASLERVERYSWEVSVRQELQHAAELLKDAGAEFEKNVKVKKEKPSQDVPRKPRRWFKGVGQIAQGAALTIANVALAIGTLKFPVSPETQTWGATASVATGIGTVLGGVGDLRNE